LRRGDSQAATTEAKRHDLAETVRAARCAFREHIAANDAKIGDTVSDECWNVVVAQTPKVDRRILDAIRKITGAPIEPIASSANEFEAALGQAPTLLNGDMQSLGIHL
jgi:hypothetical protein